MCGIAGYYGTRLNITPAELESMTAVLHHRGPDGRGTWTSPHHDCGLAHTRLSIIDLAAGQQPMLSHDGRYAITFNGEIYNHQSLRHELQKLGHTFQTKSDTEVILEAYRRWGKSAPEHFHGMFAFAIYDTQSRTLFGARDRTGIKPFYYAPHPRGGWLFASEMKAILLSPEIPRRLNLQALVDFLALGYPIAPKTMFADIQELPPGSTISLDSESIHITHYWQWQRSVPKEQSPTTPEEAADQALDVLKDSLSEHLVSDVPVAALLSGGIDSTLIAAILANELGVSLDVFHVRFPFRGYDESPYAQQVARSLNLPYHEVTVDQAPPNIDEVESIFGLFDQPFGDSSALPSYFVFREIRQHVKVALGGDGADEMFGGYPRFGFCDLANSLGNLPNIALDSFGLAIPFTRIANRGLSRKFTRIYKAARAQGTDRLFRLSGYAYPDDVIASLSQPACLGLSNYRPTLLPPGLPDALNTPVDGLCFRDSTIQWTLPADYLRKVDVMSSAHGLEVRVPYLGEKVLQFASSLQKSLLYNRKTQKILLRKLAASRLPTSVVQKKKTGFEIPLDAWLGPEGRQAVADKLLAPDAPIRQLFKTNTIEPLVHSFVSQKWDQASASRFNVYQRVYLLWTLHCWMRNWNVSLP